MQYKKVTKLLFLSMLLKVVYEVKFLISAHSSRSKICLKQINQIFSYLLGISVVDELLEI